MPLGCTLIKPTPFALLRLCPFLIVKVTSKRLTRALLVLLWVSRAIFRQNCRPRTHWALIDIRKDDPTMLKPLPGRDAFLYAAALPPLPCPG
ncbi:hypothetical protein GGI42DRAFT_36481 [Trichoderma sp. SZMC 28013]